MCRPPIGFNRSNANCQIHRISLLSSLHIHHSRSEESEHKKSLNWNPKSKSSLRIPQCLNSQSLNLFLSANNQPPSTGTPQQPLPARPSSFLFFHHRRPPFHQPPWEPKSTQPERRLSSLHQVSYSIYLVSPPAKINWFSLLCW